MASPPRVQTPPPFPENRDRKNVEKDKPKAKTEKKQQGDQESLF